MSHFSGELTNGKSTCRKSGHMATGLRSTIYHDYGRVVTDIDYDKVTNKDIVNVRLIDNAGNLIKIIYNGDVKGNLLIYTK